MRILAGDIGGTNTRLQLVDNAGATPAVIASRSYPSQAYADLESAIGDFLAHHPHPKIDSACLAVAGPVQVSEAGQSARLTNLPWQLNSVSLSQKLGIPRLRLLNDFQATAYGIAGLQQAELVTLQEGSRKAKAPCLVLGAGTGLGVCQLIWQGDFYEAIPGEGGHLAFAPTSELEDELLHFMRLELGRVSCERLLSGSGISAIYRFLLHREAIGDDALLHGPDPAAAISAAALNGSSRRAEHALEIFCAIYGAVAGDLALINLAHGGVYIAGGIAPRILPLLQQGGFLHAFHAKGRMRPLSESMPVQVVTNTDVGLLGAALAGGRL